MLRVTNSAPFYGLREDSHRDGACPVSDCRRIWVPPRFWEGHGFIRAVKIKKKRAFRRRGKAVGVSGRLTAATYLASRSFSSSPEKKPSLPGRHDRMVPVSLSNTRSSTDSNSNSFPSRLASANMAQQVFLAPFDFSKR